MIMPRGQELLMPVNPLFIALSIIIALALNMLPWGGWAWMPDLLLVVLAFWGVHQSGRVGMTTGFVLGLCMDVHQSALLGQHALSYVLMMFACRMASRRMLWFNVLIQAGHMLPLFVLAHGVAVLVRMVAGGIFPGPQTLVAPLIETLLWPLASWLLLAPQRRPPDRDSNRPL
ncbi:MAG: rod shape-determining protein MreD [Acidovorax sp.]|jgi:rod shape-determining protein MreD|nr:rod shape-determining protein MreD [Acidovorax sp.]MDR3005548.1 rod shape-determining protein MreD [Acidovorax sp.]